MFGMRAALIVERDIPADADPRIADAVIGMQIDLLVLDRLPEPFDKHVIAPAALPSMLMRMPRAWSAPVNARLVNWLPWSVLKISGLP